MESAPQGETTPDLLEETIGANFERTVATYPDHEVLVELGTGRRWTYTELDRDVDAVARGLLAAGLQKGDRIGIWAPNCAYGMTETSPVSCQTRSDDDLDRRTATIGRVHPHVEIKIVGRIKDMVIRGGENIYPREIEEFLHTHPDVEDVQVVGVPDERYGEELCAWIRLRPGADPLDADAVRAYATGKLAHYKIPRYVMVVEEFPMTLTGKVRKVQMREESAHRLGID